MMNSVLLLFVLIFAGCSNEPGSGINSQKTLQADDQKLLVDQETAAKAEEEIKNIEEVTDVVAVNDKKLLLLGFKVKQFDKFRTKQIEKKVKERLSKSFPDYEITASSDLKIFIETTKIKNKLADQSSKERTKKMEKVIKLSNKQT